MVQIIQVFDVRSVNEELENEFHAFFNKNNLLPLFTDEYLASSITVTDLDLRSVVNEGKASKVLETFAELITIGNDNKMYQEALFRIIEEARSFQSMIKKINELNQYIMQIDEKDKHNTWNIVWYNKDLK